MIARGDLNPQLLRSASSTPILAAGAFAMPACAAAAEMVGPLGDLLW